MKACSRGITLFLVFLLATMPILADSKIVARWVLTGVPMPKLKQILVIAVLDNYLIRQEFEDQMERLLAKSGVEGIPSSMVLPPKNEMMEGELKQRIKESTLDAVLVIRPKAVRQETQEVITGGFYVPPPGYYSFLAILEHGVGTVLSDQLLYQGEHHRPSRVQSLRYERRKADLERRNRHPVFKGLSEIGEAVRRDAGQAIEER